GRQGGLGKRRQQRRRQGVPPQPPGGQGHGGAGGGLLAGTGLDLDIAGDAIGQGIARHRLEGRHRLAHVGGRMPAAGIQARQFGERLHGGGARAVGGAVQGVVVQQDEHVVAAEFHVELEHAEAVLGAHAHGRQGVLGRQAAAAAMRDVGRVGPGGQGGVHAGLGKRCGWGKVCKNTPSAARAGPQGTPLRRPGRKWYTPPADRVGFRLLARANRFALFYAFSCGVVRAFPAPRRANRDSMFYLFCNHRRWMQFILLILIVPSFFLVGIQGYESFISREPELATVAGQPITRGEFDMAHRNQLEQFRQRLGSQFDPALVDTPAMREQLLNQLIDQRLLAQVAADNRFSVSDGTLRNTIAAIPQVQDNGRFSPERYRQVLAAQGMTPTSFEAGLRRDLAVARVLEPVTQSASAPATVTAALESALTQQRTVQVRRFDADAYRAGVTVSDQDIKAWYDA